MGQSMQSSDLWQTRRAAEEALRTGLRPYAVLIENVLSLTDECIDRLTNVDEAFARVLALTLVKARHLTLACYSLCLDHLAQEAGAVP